jgi:hypothetical protein
MARRTRPDLEPEEFDLQRGLALGFIAMAPMIVAYEWAVAATGASVRTPAERLLTLWTLPFGDAGVWVRRGAWALLLLAALWHVRRGGASVRRGVARIVLEGVGWALLLGPVLVLLQGLFGELGRPPEASWTDPSGDPPALALGGFLLGVGAFEELVFRVGLYGVAFLGARRLFSALGLAPGGARWGAEAAGLTLSSLAFAAFHYDRFVHWLYAGGLPFDQAGFTWRLMAGILLGVLFRARGPGVAAWAHGLFDIALLVGVSPEVLQ